MHAHADRLLELAAGRRADRLDHRAAAADEDALLGLGLDPQQRVDLDEVVALDDLVDLDLDRVRDLLARAVQHLLAHELGQPHVLGLIGDLLEREQERPLGRELDEVLGPDDDIVLFEYVKRDNRETGAALTGIELGGVEGLAPLLARIEAGPLKIQHLAPGTTAYRFLV